MVSSKRSTSMAVEEIESNYDILTDILVRLPPKSFFRFKVVSNRWNKILADAYFLERYILRIKKKNLICDDKRLLAFIQMNKETPISKEFPSINILLVHKNIVKNIPDTFGDFIHSSHGLILCDNRGTYHVVNPLTRKSVSVPRPPMVFYFVPTMALVYEEEDNAHELAANFKILAVTGFKPSEILMLQTYSSKTGKWTISNIVSKSCMCICSRGAPPLVSNGVVHWYSGSWDIVLYDSSKEVGHLDKSCAQLIRLPRPVVLPGENRVGERFSLTRSNDNVLWFSVSNKHGIWLWTLPKGEYGTYMRSTTVIVNEWICKYTFSWVCCNIRQPRFFSLQTLVPLGGTIPAAVLMDAHGLYVYNFESNSLKLVQCHEHGQAILELTYYPYLESTFLSSYILPHSVAY